jgi:hypothetical protein
VTTSTGTSDSDRGDDKRGKKKEKKKYYKKKGGDAHVCREWDSDESSTDSSGEDAANITVNKGLLFPKVGHKCFMAKYDKKKKVQTRTTPSILHLVMRVVLVMMKMLCLLFCQP